jgi:hypothetical protein
MQVRTLVAVILSSLAGSGVYVALIYLGSSTAPVLTGGELIKQALPAMLASMMFLTFVLLPLWRRLQRSEAARRTLVFLLTGSAAWLALSTALLLLTTWDPRERLATASQFMVPGIVVVLVFRVVAGRG